MRKEAEIGVGAIQFAASGGLDIGAAFSVITAGFDLVRGKKKLSSFVPEAAKMLEDSSPHEIIKLDKDKRTDLEKLAKELLASGDRNQILEAALLGSVKFNDTVFLTSVSLDDLSENQLGYLRLLLMYVSGLVMRFVQEDPARFIPAISSVVRSLDIKVELRPTVDHVSSMIKEAIGAELRSRRFVMGDRPQLAAHFVSREELTFLKETFANGGQATVSTAQGMSGVGKSQIASAFAQECENSGWQFVGWVAASTRAQAVGELARFARNVGISTRDEDPDEAAKILITWLSSNGPGDRLLVFDNVNALDDVKDLIPRGEGMRVLLTTTRQTKTLGTPVPLGVYSEGQAVDYLEDMTKLGDTEGAKEVAEDLGYLPLALTQAGAAINLLNSSYGDYQVMLDRYLLDEVMEREDGEPYPLKVGAALRIAYTTAIQHLTNENPMMGEVARTILEAMSFMAASGVPRKWLSPDKDISSAGKTSGEPGEISGLAELGGQNVGRAIGKLVENSILTKSEDGTIVSLHRLQSQVIREDLTGEDLVDRAVHAALSILESVDLPDAKDYVEKRDLNALLGSQLQEIYSQPYSELLVKNQSLLSLVAVVMMRAGTLLDPYTPISLASYTQTMTDVWSADHPDTLVSRDNLAGAYESAGRVEEAIPLFEGVLADKVRVLGPDHPGTLTSRNNLAGAYGSAGRVEEAVTLYEQNLADRVRVLGPDHPGTFTSRNNLAGAYRSAGRAEKAIPLHEQNLADRVRVLGPDHPGTLTSRNNLAVAYRSAGRAEKAISLLEQTLADSVRVLGPDHPNTLASRDNLAGAYESAGRVEEAIPLFEGALADRVRVLGPDHPNTLTSRHNLAGAYESAGRVEEAIPLLEQTLADSVRVLGPDHPDTLTSRHNLAGAYESEGRVEEAITLYKRVLADRVRVLGPDHPDTLTSRNNLAAAYETGGRSHHSF